jgi:hypothetical protein
MSSGKINGWTITDQNVVVSYDGETHIVKRSDSLADRLIKALKEGRQRDIPGLVSAAARIETFSKGAFQVKDGRVMINGVAAPEVLSNKIVRFSNDGLPFQPLLKFAAKLQENPSFRAVNELYQFLEKNDHPITETGNFIAYKRVRSNFKDIHSGTFDNSVGRLVEVPRNQVDEDSSRTCSYGLHVANWNYAHTQFASHDSNSDIMLEVEVSPSDVVAIPSDYNQSKMRCCRYKVLGIVTTPFDPATSLRVVDQESFDRDQEVEEEVDSCSQCGADVYDGGELCTECDYDDERCVDCGEQGCHESCDTVCVACEDGECCGECNCCEEEDDEYPYEDEVQY